MYIGTDQLYIDNDTLYMSCPVCSRAMTAIINGSIQNATKCNYCKSKYDLTIKRRRHYRRGVIIPIRGFSSRIGAFCAQMHDISIGGLKFSITEFQKDFFIEEFININFLLNNKKITVMVQVLNICQKNTYGCIFLTDYSSKEAIDNIHSWIQSYNPIES